MLDGILWMRNKLSISLSFYQLKGRKIHVLADIAVVYMLDRTSMIAYNSSCSSEEHGYVCVSSLESLGNYEQRLTIGKLLELELSLSDYLSLPSKENLPSWENDECIG